MLLGSSIYNNLPILQIYDYALTKWKDLPVHGQSSSYRALWQNLRKLLPTLWIHLEPHLKNSGLFEPCLDPLPHRTVGATLATTGSPFSQKCYPKASRPSDLQSSYKIPQRILFPTVIRCSISFQQESLLAKFTLD